MTTFHITYEKSSFSSTRASYTFKLGNDEISVRFPQFSFSIGVGHDFTQIKYYDYEDDTRVNLDTTENFVNQLITEGVGNYGSDVFRISVTDDEIYIDKVTLKKTDELVNEIIEAFTEIRNNMWQLINDTALVQLDFYIKHIINKDHMIQYVEKYNDEFLKLYNSTYCSSDFKERYSKIL